MLAGPPWRSLLLIVQRCVVVVVVDGHMRRVSIASPAIDQPSLTSPLLHPHLFSDIILSCSFSFPTYPHHEIIIRFASVSSIYPKSKLTHGTPAIFLSTSLVYARLSTNLLGRISSSPSTLTVKLKWPT